MENREDILKQLRLRVGNCNDKTKEGRARKGAYVDAIMVELDHMKEPRFCEKPYVPFYKPYGMTDEEYEFEVKIANQKLAEWEDEQTEQERAKQRCQYCGLPFKISDKRCDECGMTI